MSDIRVLHEPELRARIELDLAAIDIVQDAFARLSDGGVEMPPVLSMHMPQVNGEVDVKTAFVPGLPGFAVKISPGFFDNPSKGLPSTSGLMVVLSSETGRVSAVLLDNGYLTDVRTAAAGGVAARKLSRPDASHAAIFGTGLQARMQLRALCLVRPITNAMIWGRDLSKAEAMAAEMTTSALAVTAVADPAEAASRADIIVTTTPATEPILKAEWLCAGQHITAMGSDQAGKGELEPACIGGADLYVADRVAQTRKMGELRAALAAGYIAEDAAIPELGDVITGRHPGRTSLTEITIADLTGTGVQDTAIASRALAAFD